jgi:hypothetical protein
VRSRGWLGDACAVLWCRFSASSFLRYCNFISTLLHVEFCQDHTAFCNRPVSFDFPLGFTLGAPRGLVWGLCPVWVSGRRQSRPLVVIALLSLFYIPVLVLSG